MTLLLTPVPYDLLARFSRSRRIKRKLILFNCLIV